MRRLPLYFLVDVSESMVGEPIEQVQNGMRRIIQNLRLNPYALETAFISVIAFAGRAKSLSQLTELYKFYPPTFPIGGGISLGFALNYLMDDLDNSIQKTTLEVKGNWKPIIFLFTDGTPTDDYKEAFERWNTKYRKICNLIAVFIGDNVDLKILGEITDNVLRLNDTEDDSFNQFFDWVTDTIKNTSVSVCLNDDLQLAPIKGINLEKVDVNKAVKTDENFVVLLCKCQTTKQNYLVKYAKLHGVAAMGELGQNCSLFRLVNAYSIDEEVYMALSGEGAIGCRINSAEMHGIPVCPCCGNRIGLVVCECGNVFCVDNEPKNTCPWCGLEGELGSAGVEGVNVNRGIG